MNMNQMNLFLIRTRDIFNNSIDKIIEFSNGLARYTPNDKIRLDNFAFDNNLSIENAENILNTLCEINMMHKTDRACRCPKCGLLFGELPDYDIGFTFTCDNCNTESSYNDIRNIETIYSIMI